MAPAWVQLLGYVSLGVALLCSLVIAADILAGRRQHMPVMNFVWIVSAWYLGPAGLWFYWMRGRRMSKPMMMRMMSERNQRQGAGSMHERMTKMMRQMVDRQPFWLTAAKATMHCGAGCMLGDLIGEWIVFATASLWPARNSTPAWRWRVVLA